MNRLMKLLPAYYHTNQEMLDIATADLPELDQLWALLSTVLDNQFILTMDVNRVRQWERLLRIRADPTTSTLDQRKQAILLRLQMHPPVTRSWLDHFLTNRFHDNYDLDIVHNDHHLTLSIKYDDFFVLREISRLLRHLIPVTLGVDFTQVIQKQADTQAYTSVTTGRNLHFYTLCDREALPQDIHAYSGVVSGLAQTLYTISDGENLPNEMQNHQATSVFSIKKEVTTDNG